MLPLSLFLPKLLIVVFGLIVSFFSFSVSANNYATKNIAFNDQEEAYLKKHPTLKVNVDNAWFPFNFVENEQVKGYSNEMIQLVASKVGLKVEFVTGYQRSDYLNMLKTGEIDLISNIKSTPEREKSLIFTQYNPLKVINSLLTLSGHSDYVDFNLLKGKKVAVVKGFFYEELMRIHYPEINLILTKDSEQSIQQLIQGDADAVLDSYVVLDHYTRHYFINGVKNNPLFHHPVFNYLPLYMGLSPDKRVLRDILNKGLLALSDQELAGLRLDWSHSVEQITEGGFDEKMPVFRMHELHYLQKKGRLRMCVDPQWMPIEGIDKGEYAGMGGDFVRLFTQRISNPIELVKTDSWAETLALAKQGKCDFIPIISKTEKRQSYLSFSFPYLHFPLVLVTQESEPVKRLKSVSDRPIGIVKDYAYKESLEEEYPNSNLIEFDSSNDGLNALERGEIYGFIDSFPVMARQIQQNYPTLKIIDKFEHKYSLSLAVTKSNPLLLGIFNKVIATISVQQHEKIVNRWLPLVYEKESDLKWFWFFLIAIMLVFVIFIVRYFSVVEMNKSLTEMQDKLEKLAMRDSLTGLPNHYFFSKLLEKEWAIAKSSKNPLSVVLFDIDHFKNFNDQYGRLAGDSCLIELTVRLQSVLTHPNVLLARYGGEEFALILPETDKEELTCVLEDIFYVVKQWALPHHGLETESIVTISAGASCLVFDERFSADELVRRADSALFNAQQKGFNQFAFYGDS